MRVKKGDIEYREDYDVDFSKKERVVRNNNLISSKHAYFSPEDLLLETSDYDGNPSVNKTSACISNYFDNNLNTRSRKLNKGRRLQRRRRRAHSFFDEDNKLDY